MAAEYKLTVTSCVERTADKVWIPNDPANVDWQAYQAWLAEGGVPDPYTAPPPPPPPASFAVMFDHENRLRSMEGTPPLTMEDFESKLAPK